MNAVLKESKNLVLLNDDQSSRQASKWAFNQYDQDGSLILEPGTGSQGLKIAGKRRPDYTLLNALLPDLNNGEFGGELKQGPDKLTNQASNWTLPPDKVFPALSETQAIRDKEEALEQLRHSEAKYRSLVEQIPAITYIASLETPVKLLYLSPQIQQLGYPAEDWLNDPQGLLKRVHADDLPLAREAYAQTYEHHVPLRCEYRLINSNGKISWYLDEANVVRDEAGGSLFLQGILVDITQDKANEQELFYYRQRLKELVDQRTVQLKTQCEILKAANTNLDQSLLELRQANAALTNSENYFRLLLETTDEGVVGVDAKGRCTFVNQAALAMLGYAEEELMEQDLHQIIHYGDTDDSLIPAEDWPVYTAFRACARQRSTELFRRKDGRFFPVEYSACPMTLDVGVHGAVMVFRDVTKSQTLMQTLAHQASHDPLTGLINRTEFERRLDRMLRSAHLEQSEHVLCYLDLDHFKKVNDSCGHAAGDELLRSLSSLLAGKLRQRDTFARLGGDEFAILFEHMLLDQALCIVGELCESLRNFRFTWQGNTFSVGASIGLKTLCSDDSDAGIVLEAADAACYLAKKNGGNQVQVFKSVDKGNFYSKKEIALG